MSAYVEVNMLYKCMLCYIIIPMRIQNILFYDYRNGNIYIYKKTDGHLVSGRRIQGPFWEKNLQDACPPCGPCRTQGFKNSFLEKNNLKKSWRYHTWVLPFWHFTACISWDKPAHHKKYLQPFHPDGYGWWENGSSPGISDPHQLPHPSLRGQNGAPRGWQNTTHWENSSFWRWNL